jgi:hypothetical protein
MSQLTIARVWLIECQRCANEESSFEPSADLARAEFALMGWDDDFCPACNGVKR